MAYKFNPLIGVGLDEVGTGGGGSTNPGGSNTQVQFNDGGSTFGGDDGLTFNKTTNELTVGANTGDGGSAKVYGDINLDDGGASTTTIQCVTPTLDRTISFPDATGTVALVAGSSGQPIYNNAGAYAGLSTATIGTTGNITLSLNGASGVAPVAITGTWFAGTTPQVLIQPSTATAGAWNASGTGLGINAASGFTGRLLDLQLNGTSNFSVSSTGTVTSQAAIGAVAGFAATRDTAIRFASSNLDPFSGTQLAMRASPFTSQTLCIGGIGSTNTALKSNSGTLEVRLGDNSAYATVDAELRAQGTAPASASATGTAGDIRYDADYIYVCTATNTWKRAALATW